MATTRSTNDDTDMQPPILFRLVLWAGQLIGLRWVRDNHVRTIYRMESYNGVRGPNFFRINGWKERLGPSIFIGPRFRTCTFANLSTRDPLRVGIRLSLSYTFDPRKTTPEIATQLVALKDDVFALIVESAALKAIRVPVAEEYFERIRQGTVYPEIERKAQLEFDANPTLSKLGMRIGTMQILEPLLPDTLETRLEQTAQHRFNIAATKDWEPPDVVKGLAIEIVEKLNAQGQGEQYLNTGDILNAVQQMPWQAAPATKVIDGGKTIKALDQPGAPEVPPAKPSTKPPAVRKVPPPPTYFNDKQ